MDEIKEAYISFEIAKLLKEKGFNIETNWYYKNEDVIVSNGPEVIAHPEDYYAKPTHQMALAWLREKHSIFIEIGTSIDINGDYHFNYTILDKECKYRRRGYTAFDWNYEDAVEAALKYVLENLI